MTTKKLAFFALIAAVYAVSTVALGNLAYGPVQFRPAEALTLLPFLFPGAQWGLFVGCGIANFASSYGVLDIVFGSLATLLAGWLTSRFKNVWLAAFPPVIVNALVVSTLIFINTPNAALSLWPETAGSIFLTQALWCYGLGVPLTFALKRLKPKLGGI